MSGLERLSWSVLAVINIAEFSDMWINPDKRPIWCMVLAGIGAVVALLEVSEKGDRDDSE